MKLKFGLHTKMALLCFSSILIAVLAGGALVVERFTAQLEREMGMRAIAIARTLAQMEDIRQNVGRPGGAQVIQPLAERIRLATDVAYVVVLDNNGIRYSHPLQDRIGRRFSDPDLARALTTGDDYISPAEGVVGPSVRAFVPIKTEEGTRQVGVVVVGILTPTIHSVLKTIRMELYFALAFGLLVGLLGSLYLARRIKRGMFNLEPEQIARLLEERIAILQSINEGILAVDSEARITLVNEAAQRIMGAGNVLGRPVREIIPDSALPRVLVTGRAEYNQEMLINQVVVVTNRIPIRVKGRIVGAVASFRNKTEVQRLAEELTGVKKFIEALRVQNHEHMNKLHTIAGLIQLNRLQEALDYIFRVTAEQQELTQFLARNVHDYGIAGMLLGKHSRAKEMRIELVIDHTSRLQELPPHIDSSAMVIIIGNLLENAFEAVRQLEPERRSVYAGLFDEPDGVTIVVRDRGPGIPPEERERIFLPGYSTHGVEGRGLGLALVKRYVDLAGGAIRVEDGPGGGAVFRVTIPRREERKNPWRTLEP
ncbi:MAG: sensor histidine kinase [Bacillota bacterium]|nr:sensor histidine kinase [Bacillota bacterium]